MQVRFLKSVFVFYAILATIVLLRLVVHALSAAAVGLHIASSHHPMSTKPEVYTPKAAHAYVYEPNTVLQVYFLKASRRILIVHPSEVVDIAAIGKEYEASFQEEALEKVLREVVDNFTPAQLDAYAALPERTAEGKPNTAAWRMFLHKCDKRVLVPACDCCAEWV